MANPFKAFGRFIRETAAWTQSALGMGAYNATNPRRKIMPNRRARGATANEISTANLPQMRAWSRQIERNNPMARAAVDGRVAIVVGHGIALEPDFGDDQTNCLIGNAWHEWCEHASADGRNIYELQAQTYRDQIIAGECIWRLVMLPEREAKGDIPLAILPLESEWLDDMWNSAVVMQPNERGEIQYGPVLLDKYGRPVNYRLRNPETNSLWPPEIIPASGIVHVFERRRSMQCRGEPSFAPVIETFQQDRDLIDCELQAAITCSSIGIAITSEYQQTLDTQNLDNSAVQTGEGTPDDPAQDLRLGSVARLMPGETIESFSHNRPGQQIQEFRKGLKGDVAAALKVPVRFLDRDVSNANYSSMRCDMLDSERMNAPYRDEFGHQTVGRMFREVLPFLCAKVGVKMPTKIKYRLVPDGQPYVDPVKDIEASLAAIRGGLSTFEIEVGKNGGDAKRVLEQLKNELKDPLWNEIFTAPDEIIKQSNQPKQDDKKPEDDKSDKKKDTKDDMDRQDFLAGLRTMADSMRSQPAQPNITNNNIRMELPKEVIAMMPEQKAPVVNITVEQPDAPTINVAAPSVSVEAPNVTIQPADVRVNVEAPNVTVQAPDVTIENEVIMPSRTIKATPDGRGSVIMTPQDN